MKWREWKDRQVSVWTGAIVVALAAFFVGVFLVYRSESVVRDIDGSPHNSMLSSFVSNFSFEILLRAFRQLPDGRHTVEYTPIFMDRMKRQGCVTDGLLSGYGETEESVAMINRSECYYLHRALETWLNPPDFEKADRIRAKITKSDMVYGMFLAEAVDKKADYFYPIDNRNFSFSKMCEKDTKNRWGEHTCIPSFKQREYRRYVEYITAQAMNHGIQVFMFGQVNLQDDIKNPKIGEVIQHMREYADLMGVDIVVGAQTNTITDPNYLALFDFIEGGVGIDADGRVEDKPCSSRWWSEDSGGWCWALLWNDRYASRARNVFTHLDWNGSTNDDMAIYARMGADKRYETLKFLHAYFEKKHMGFMLPLMATLPKGNGGCYGEGEGYYSAANAYSCKDEEHINDILRKEGK